VCSKIKIKLTSSDRVIEVIAFAFLIMFAFITYQTIKTAQGTSSGLGTLFLPLFLTLIFAIIIFYFVLAFNNRNPGQ